MFSINQRKNPEKSSQPTSNRGLEEVYSGENQLREAFIDIFHEINQPLSSLANFAFAAKRLLAEDQPSTADLLKLREWLESISTQSNRAAEMMQHLRLLGRSNQVSQPFQLEQFIAGVIQNVKQVTPCSVTQVEVSCPTSLPAVEGDQAQLDYLLRTLITTIVSWQEDVAESPRLKIHVRLVNNLVEVAVHGPSSVTSDTEVDASGSNRFALGICCWIVQLHGGLLQYKVQEGSRGYRFTWPLAE